MLSSLCALSIFCRILGVAERLRMGIKLEQNAFWVSELMDTVVSLRDNWR